MKKLLLILLFVVTCGLKAQYAFVNNNTTPQTTNKINPEMYDYVQQVLAKKQIHIHTDSVKHGFTICCDKPNQKFKITNSEGKVKLKGKVKDNLFVSTEKWNNGTYILLIGDVKEVIWLMRN